MEKRTFAELLTSVDAVAHGLSSFGIKRGDVVAFSCLNHVDFFAVFHGCLKVGATMSPFSPLYSEFEIATQLQKSKASLLIAHDDVLDTCAKGVERAGGGIGLLSLGTDIAEWVSTGSSKPFTADHQDVDQSEEIALLPYSSGTTGLPKGTMLTHANLAVNVLQTHVCESGYWSTDGTEVVLSPLPLFHIYPFTVSLHLPLRIGVTFVTMKQFDLERFCQLCEEFKATRAHVVPPIVLALAKSPVVDKYDLSSLKTGISAAAPLGKDIAIEASKRLNCQFKQAWGMSELSPVATLVPDDDIENSHGSVGYPVSDTQAKVVDMQTGETIPMNGGEGELCIKGPQVMKGYLDEPEKTKECLTDHGWLHTGDVARMDEEGRIYITDRLKELIKYKGFQVAPAEIEALLCTHPEILDATVIPKPCEIAGELPRAYVVKRDKETSNLTEEDVQLFVEERTAHYKKLRGGVVFTDQIPKTASGKILRRHVVELDRKADE